MASGKVKWYNTSKGFGFIEPDDGGADVFVHVSAVERAGLTGLQEGQPLDFEMERDRRSGKTSAGNLIITGEAPPSSGGGGGAAAAAVSMVVPTPGFWALPGRDFGHQLWSFAPPHAQEMMVAAPAMSGEASAARVGNYLPMAQANLNLLASFSGGPGAAAAATAGRAEEEAAH